MKLILDKNFIQEVEEFPKETKKGFKYKGWALDGDEIEPYDVEANEIAPIVRFLATGKKGKISWLLISGAIFLLFVFFVLMFFLLQPKKEAQPVPQVTKQVELTSSPVDKKDIEVIKTETKKEDTTETSWSLDLFNEVDMYKDMSNEASIEIQRLNFVIDKKDLEIEKLTNMVNNLQEENAILLADKEKLQTRKINSPTDEFIYYLGDNVYKTCQSSVDEQKIANCQKIYYNFLEYGTK